MYLVAIAWSGQRGTGAGAVEIKCSWGENNPRKHRAFEGVSVRAGSKSGCWFVRLKGPAFTATAPYNYDTMERAFSVAFSCRIRATGGHRWSARGETTRWRMERYATGSCRNGLCPARSGLSVQRRYNVS